MDDYYPNVEFFRPNDAIGFVSGNLPHWRQDGAVYFVTFRLADSLPQARLRELRTEISATVPASERDAELILRTERFLDAGYGACVLAKPTAKAIVEDALRCFDGTRYCLEDAAVMPNHVHVLVVPLGTSSLTSILHSWKSYTSNRICGAGLAMARLWQRESFDHIVRSAEYMEKYRDYIAQNRRFAETLAMRDR